MNEIEQTIENYMQGTYQADIDLLRSVFHPKAKMSGFLGGQLIVDSPEPFFQDIGSRASMKESGIPYQARILNISRSGNIASAVIIEENFFGANSMETHFELIFTESKWRIIAKNFTELNW